MSTPQDVEPRFDTLLCAMAEGELTAAQILELGELLGRRPDLRDRYLEFVELATMLEEELSGIPAADLRHTIARMADRPARRLRLGGPALLAASMLAMASVAAVFAIRIAMDPGDPASQRAEAESGVAVVTQTVDAQWDAAGLAADAGRPLSAGKLKLTRGLAQIEFYSGATVILEGPAEFDLVSAERGFFHYGKIRAHVPPHAQGFMIGTSEMDVVDLGTEFGLSRSPEGVAEVHVFEGKVELHDPATRSHQELTEGQGVRWSANTQPQPIGTDAAAFVNRSRLADLSGGSRELAMARWQQFSKSLRSRPDVLLHYDFETQEPWQRVLENRAPSSAAPSGAIVGAQWAQGRWPGKGALEFKRSSDRVRIDVPGSFEALTLSAWVRFDTFENLLNALLICESVDHGHLRWQVAGDGSLILSLILGPRASMGFRTRAGVLTEADLGRWIHLTTVLDARIGHVAHYINGQSLGEITMVPFGRDARGGTVFPDALSIGLAQIGNWSSTGVSTVADERWMTRNFNGRLDELIVFDQALSPDEVQQLYKAGRP